MNKNLISYLLPITVSAVLFYIVLGGEILRPSNTSWLTTGDGEQNYLAWEFFRSSPWTFPLGLNPNYGMELSSSIVYSGSIPFLSIFFKLINFILPKENFQFYGIWLLVCFLLQSCAAWLIISLKTKDVIIKICFTILLIFSPPMLFRIGLHNDLAQQR